MKCSTIIHLLCVAISVIYSYSFHIANLLKPISSRSKLSMTKKENYYFPLKLIRKACITGVSVALTGMSISDTFPSLSMSPPVVFAATVPAVGASAPAFTLPSNFGKDLSLEDFPGKRIVLYFYPVKDFCLSNINQVKIA